MTVSVSIEQLTAWADNCIHLNHLGTLVRREIEGGDLERATDLAERARKRAGAMLNELFALGAIKPDGYAEPGVAPNSTR